MRNMEDKQIRNMEEEYIRNNETCRRNKFTKRGTKTTYDILRMRKRISKY